MAGRAGGTGKSKLYLSDWLAQAGTGTENLTATPPGAGDAGLACSEVREALMNAGVRVSAAAAMISEAEARGTSDARLCRKVKRVSACASMPRFEIVNACRVGCPHDPGEGHSRAGYAANH